jgi:DNA-binding helix-hairpin-helix protein with protein kinase domain
MKINLFFAGIGAWLLYVWASGRPPAADISKFQLRRQAAETDLRALTERWEREATPRAFDEKLSELRKLREEWLGLPKRRQERYVSLVHNREQDARTKYLDQFDIDGAVISGIGPAKKAMLESYGIETAADISRHAVLRVPGFGPALTQRLLDWRATKERGFRFDPQSGVDPRYIADLDRSISQRKNEIETALRQGPADLHHVRGIILTRRQALEGAMKQAVERLAQAGVDLKVVQ